MNNSKKYTLRFTLFLVTIASLVALLVTAVAATAVAATAVSQATGTYTTYLPALVTPRQFEANPLPGPGIDRITGLESHPDGRLFITTKNGAIYVRQPNGDLSTFLDLTSQVIAIGPEKGLFNIVFHPNYSQNGQFFVSYTGAINDAHWLIISRFQVSADPNVGNPASEERLFMVQMTAPQGLHNGGSLAFHPLNGELYVGVGDDQGNLIAQEDGTYKGKVVRLDVDNLAAGQAREYAQYADALTAVQTTVVAKGLRNPWSLSFDPYYGHLYIADVGDDTWEEINVIPLGQEGLNFGWPCLEGPTPAWGEGVCTNPAIFALPAHYYPHHPACAVIGGAVYRPANNPALPSRYIFGDYCTKELSAMSNENGVWVVESLGNITDPGFLTTIDMDQNGTVYAGVFSLPGQIYELFIP